jgi:hypothetical protein
MDWRYIHSKLVFSTQLVNCCPHGRRNYSCVLQRWASTLASQLNARHRSKTWPSIERSERSYFFLKPKAKNVPSTGIVVDHDYTFNVKKTAMEEPTHIMERSLVVCKSFNTLCHRERSCLYFLLKGWRDFRLNINVHAYVLFCTQIFFNTIPPSILSLLASDHCWELPD